ncbi:MFS transporter [Modestobacter sp. I12A-02628]|uniref:MFS transporter n=1 Tax=Goekera deserti TaxID=2497753 RepID=A0A7K3WJ94_9ACTN|nr:MFS transporter [Goekera deserti]MPQ99313.1 MFS transporter [Goekera deserti]NDI50312.1 MFS transporter [Goekera deserti]NEL56436.1 MFS transporter [Goekera deserti]
MFRALRVWNYRLFASTNLVSQTGMWVQRIGQDWLVLQLSGDSGVALGLITALQFGPALVFSLVGGVLADRYDKRRLIMVTQTVMGLLALVLGSLVALDVVRLWHVLVLALLLGVVSAIDAPLRQSFVSELVGPGLLTNAVGLNSTIFNSARLIGPAVAGGVITASGGSTTPTFFLNAASFAVTIAALARMRRHELHPSDPVPRGRGQLRAGIAYTRGRPDLVLAMVLAFVVGTFGFNTQVTIALMARQVYDAGAGAFGFLTTCYAVGSLCGALLSTRRQARPRQRFLVLATIGFGLLTVVCGLMPSYATFAVALVPAGAAGLLFAVACNSFVQLGVEPQMRGRVLSLYLMCFLGGTPVGAPTVGWLAEHLGAPVAFVASGALVVVAGCAAGLVLSRGRRVRLEAHVLPPRVRLHVGARTGSAVPDPVAAGR